MALVAQRRSVCVFCGRLAVTYQYGFSPYTDRACGICMRRLYAGERLVRSR